MSSHTPARRMRVAPPVLLLSCGVLSGFTPALRGVQLRQQKCHQQGRRNQDGAEQGAPVGSGRPATGSQRKRLSHLPLTSPYPPDLSWRHISAA
ncbi:hypothetical protein [Nonomuraea sp. SYSU D8015]|uniref:hypothetical protein n=1 Tax=Nonomuraea sp. SYSU D8015 TaxID=2593644 RepID=UPI001CB6F9AC|nr:hypothetical protein [Nonomuraea sp. SYSU D8015]